MSNEFLTQDEVDALLTGVDGADETAATTPAPVATRTLNQMVQERPGPGRMPAVELVIQRFCRLLRSGLFNFMGRAPTIVAAPLQTIKYADFLASVPTPAYLDVTELKPLHGCALFAFEPALVYLVVDNLFGGDGRFQPSAQWRDCTPSEKAILQRMHGVVVDALQKSWNDLFPLTFSHLRSETNPQFATVADATDLVVAASFTITSGAGSGALRICIPYAALEPIRSLVHGTGEKRDRLEPDAHWVQTLSRDVVAAQVELVADLVKLPVTVNQLLHMTVGDILSVEIPEMVTAQVDGVPIFDCRFGTLNGQYALRIASVRDTDRESISGVSHA